MTNCIAFSFPLWMSRPKTLFATLLVAALFSGGAAQPPDMPPVPVTTGIVEEGAYSQPIRLTGSVEPFAQTAIGVEEDGVVDRLFVEAGDFVTSGAPLLQMRQLPLRLAADRAAADARRDREMLRELRAGSRPADIAIAEASWKEAKANAEIAEREFQRYEKLLAERSVSQSERDSASARAETARANESVKRAEYDLALEGPRAEVIAAMEASALSTEAEAAMARDALQRSTIRAPYPGVVTERLVDVGSWVDRGQTVLNFERNDIVKVAIPVPESQFHKVKLGDLLTISIDADPKGKYAGTVTERIPRADPRNRTFPIRIQLANPDQRLASGMLARLVLDPEATGDKSIVVPKDAIVPGVPKPIVYRVKMVDGKATAERVPVDTGRFFGEAVEVFGDLKPGQRVITRGNERVRPGAELIMDAFQTQAGGDTFDPAAFFKEDFSAQSNGK